MSTVEIIITILGLGVITVLTRSFFFIPKRELPIPEWLREGLRHAPLAALAAIVLPEVVLLNGELISTWQDARLFGAATAAAWYLKRHEMLGTIISGTSVFLVLRLGLGW